MIKAVIFDIDGTLLDTTLGIRSSVNYVTDKYNMNKLSDSEFNDFISYSPITASFSNVCKTDFKMSKICGEEFTSIYKQKYLPLAQIYPGITNLLSYLRENQYKLGIATYKNEQNAKIMISSLKLNSYFDAICGANQESKRTKKDILKECIEKINSEAKESFFIGDSKTDAIAAKDLGTKFIGVTYGFGFREEDEIKSYNPIFIANSPEKILKFMEKNDGK